MKVRQIRQANDAEWDAIWSQCDYATYFHSREWARLWRDKYELDPKLFFFSDGKKALLPLLSTKALKGLAKNYYSSCCGTYGGPIAGDPLTTEHEDLMKGFMAKTLGSLQWRMNPFDPLAPNAGEPSAPRDMTSSLRLGQDFEAIVKNFAHQNRTNIRKASQNGIRVSPATGLEDWKAYFSVYQDSLKRWGDEATSNYPWELFEKMHGLGSGNIRLWLALRDDKIVAGNLCFYAKKVIVSWHGAALEEFFNMRPVNMLWHEIIRDSCERGYHWLDFGPSGGHEGVLRFKKSFGTDELSCPMMEIAGALSRFADQVRGRRG